MEYEWESEHTRCEYSPTSHHEWERNSCKHCLIAYAHYARQELVPLMGSGETWDVDPMLAHLINLRRSRGWEDTFIARQWTDDIWRTKGIGLPQHLVEYLVSIIPYRDSYYKENPGFPICNVCGHPVFSQGTIIK